MNQAISASGAQMKEALDLAPMAVLVSSAGDNRLLYANRLAKDVFLKDLEEGENGFFPAGPESMAGEYRHPVNHRIYRFNVQRIDWGGEPAHIQYISDITDMVSASEKTQNIINSIPGGIAIYRVTDVFETVYFSDGVSALSGYSAKEYRRLAGQDAANLIYEEDIGIVKAKANEVIESRGTAMLEFRKKHRDGHVVWVRAQAKWMGEENGCPLLHCVFHNISDIKDAQFEMEQLLNSIPGGIASYRLEGQQLVPVFYSDGVPALSGHSKEELNALVADNTLNTVYELDRERVREAVKTALRSGEVLDISYRMYHKNGTLIWIHVRGRRMGPLTETARFYAVFTGMSEEARLFQNMANDTADGIYVIGKENYELLYLNESGDLFSKGRSCLGQACYSVLHGKSEPCGFCTLKSHKPDGKEHEMMADDSGRVFTTHFREIDWNGIPAYVKYIRDATDEVRTRRERDRLEQYFQNMLKNLPGGVAVVRYEKDGSLVPEYISEGLAATTGMTLEEAWKLYQKDALTGVHPDDREHALSQLAEYLASGKNRWEIEYRLLNGSGEYVWVKNTLSLIRYEDGVRKIYSVYSDMTKEREERAHVRQQYNDLILQHYQRPDPNALVLGHCNITQDNIIEIIDRTGMELRKTFGSVREEFFTGLSTLIEDGDQRQAFKDIYMREPALAAFKRGETEQKHEFYIQLPGEDIGRYVLFEMHMVSTPDSGDVTGILTVTDITEQTVADRILHQLSVTGYDFAADLDLKRDTYKILSLDANARFVPPRQGPHSRWMDYMMKNRVVPRDREQYWNGLSLGCMSQRLEQGGAYTFAFSLIDDDGEIRTKNMTVSPVDLRLGRVCLSRTDITESIREQQRLLRVIAYTCELAGFIDVSTGGLVMYTRQMVLENLPPHTAGNYNEVLDNLAGYYEKAADRETVKQQFRLETLRRELEERPDGYDFVLPYWSGEGLRYKQVNVLWGDQNHKTVCLVRSDVTDMLAAERAAKTELERALALSREASRAKSDFLSAMSHDIRTPMNAIMGMTTLANANIGDSIRVQSCLQKIAMSSRHLLSLINDILDMSRIEQAKIQLNRERICLPDLAAQATEIIAPQAEAAGLQYEARISGMRNPCCCGDALRTSQILINILGNAVKFTPKGGSVHFSVEEIPSVKGKQWVRYRFTVSDTGIGMSEETLAHLFEPFTRSRAVSRVEGSGLGLSIVKGLVDLMGGTISVQSELEKGSTFIVELEGKIAAAPEAAEIRKPEEPSGQPFAGKRFLVAEDNEINAEILCEILRMYGAESEVKENGALTVQAFFAAEPGTYDAILMDIQMPEMDGYQAARAIRGGAGSDAEAVRAGAGTYAAAESGAAARADAGTIPIIAMTANAFAEDIHAAMEAGMDAHIAKPIDIGILRETLKTALAD
ncbi:MULTISPECIES: PAS domain-containing hybrid sensor histidine kinase/response regulator [unclassified Clostridium]|uniref:PAS domain-containing hybrid sensor histidine kinase/response regulator n=1 Tax=unclassified Clostridium TaxID=2614128 RepID=UPI001106704B|nr:MULTISPECIES: PAS domain-containing hybrid sensor histidine kinase/response regulator [unclassified Clostridium]